MKTNEGLKVILYFNSKVIDNVHLGYEIYNRLKKGDTFTSYPFNHFGDERTEFKEEPKEYQLIHLVITNIETKLINTFNDYVRTEVHINSERFMD